MPRKTNIESIGRVKIFGKGRKERTVVLNYKVCRAIKSYLKIRPKVEFEELFISKYKKPLGVRSYQKIVKIYLNEAGINGASVHSLRHTFATHHVKLGTNIVVITEALGHKSLKTTEIYVQLAQEMMEMELKNNVL